MGNDKDTPLILGRPFLNTTNTCIYVASGQIQFHFAGRKEIFDFASGQHLFDEKQERKKHLMKRIKIKKPKPIEEPEKPIKKKNNKKRWHKKKDPSSTLSSPDPDKASEVEQEETPLLKKE